MFFCIYYEEAINRNINNNDIALVLIMYRRSFDLKSLWACIYTTQNVFFYCRLPIDSHFAYAESHNNQDGSTFQRLNVCMLLMFPHLQNVEIFNDTTLHTDHWCMSTMHFVNHKEKQNRKIYKTSNFSNCNTLRQQPVYLVQHFYLVGLCIFVAITIFRFDTVFLQKIRESIKKNNCSRLIQSLQSVT